MNAKELRIGNYVNEVNLKEPLQIEILDLENILRRDMNYQPIQLTEEWLIKFRFDHREFSFDKGSFYLMKRTGKNEYLYQAHTERFQVKYVHQLQNLYFSLKGTELVVS